MSEKPVAVVSGERVSITSSSASASSNGSAGIRVTAGTSARSGQEPAVDRSYDRFLRPIPVIERLRKRLGSK